MRGYVNKVETIMNIVTNKSFFVKLVPVLLCMCIITACTNNKPDEIVYDSSFLESMEGKPLQVDTISTDCQFAMPSQMTNIGDSLLAIFDPTGGDETCLVMNTKGKSVGRFGKRGRARDELLSPVNMTKGQNDKISIYDYASSKMVVYDVPKILSGDATSNEVFYCSELFQDIEMEGFALNATLALNKGKYLLFGNGAKRIVVSDMKTMLSEYNLYPYTDPDTECNWSIWGNMASYAISPDNTHFIVTTRIGALCEIFKFDGQRIESKVIKGIYPPKYKIAEGAVPKCVVFGKDAIEGFCTLCALNDRFYTVIGGKDCNHRHELLAFDYEGQLLEKYILPGDISCMVNIGKVFYFLIEFEDGNTGLCKATLPDVE